MRGRVQRWGPAALQLALASAEPGLSIDYRAPEECPDAAAFERLVELRIDRTTTRPRPFSPVRVRIEAQPDGYRGHVEFERSGAVREIASKDCSELSQALALVSAVFLQSEAEATVAAPATRLDAPAVPLPSPGPESPPARERPQASTHWAAIVAAGGGVEQGSLPSAWFAPRARLAVEFSSGAWAAELGTSATVPIDQDLTVAATRATFRLATGRGDLCATRRLGSLFRVGGCALFEAGTLVGRSELNNEPQRTLWLSPGIQARGELLTAKYFSVFAQASDRWPLVRSRFAFSRPTAPPSEVSVYQVPGHAFAAEAGLLLRFQ